MENRYINNEINQIKKEIHDAFKNLDNLLETRNKNHKPLAWKFEDEYSLEGHESELAKDFFGFVKSQLSAIIHKNRMRRYAEISKKPYAFRIIAEGDSWFQHPLADDIIDHLFNKDYAVCCYSEAGDSLLNMANQKEYMNALRYEMPKCFLLSGGGNDILQRSTLQWIIDLKSPDLIDMQRFQQKCSELEKAILTILSHIQAENPSLKVFMHGYDYIIPRDTLFYWVYPVLMEKNITQPADQQKIIYILINHFNELLSKIERNNPGRFYHIDLRGTLPSIEDWSDEIHPTTSSFLRITDKILKKIHSIIPR